MQSKSPVFLNAKLDAKLVAYMAAGVGTLALSQPAQAKVVYTSTNIRVSLDGTIPIDLNHDGITDFSVVLLDGYGGLLHRLNVAPQVTGNAVRSNISGAAAGFLGVPVGRGEKFGTNSFLGYGVFMAISGSAISTASGPWANATNRYLGLKFLINGQTHFGWARLTVGKYLDFVVLTGYAYETEPNVSIVEGHTSGTSEKNIASFDFLTPRSLPATLGMLARGADGLAIWRREEKTTTN